MLHPLRQTMFRTLVLLAALVAAAAFSPARVIARSNMALFEEMATSSTGKETCPKRKIDKNGRCPGEAGYVSFTKVDNRSFAEIKAEQEVRKRPTTMLW